MENKLTKPHKKNVRAVISRQIDSAKTTPRELDVGNIMKYFRERSKFQPNIFVDIGTLSQRGDRAFENLIKLMRLASIK